MYEEEISLKIVLVGEYDVGKTCLLLRSTKDIYCPKYIPTILNYEKIYCNIDSNKVTLEIYDTAGQERYQGVVKQIFRNIQGALVIFDVSNKNSFYETRKWIDLINESTGLPSLIVLVGNKSDLESQVSFDEIEDLISEYKIDYFPTSAKTGLNVKEVFEYLGKEIIRVFYKNIHKIEKSIETQNLNEIKDETKRKDCKC